MIKFNRVSGLAQILLIIGLVIMAIAVPVAAKLVERNQNLEKNAAVPVSECEQAGGKCIGWYPCNLNYVESNKKCFEGVCCLPPWAEPTVKPVTSIEPEPTILVQGECMTPDDCPIKTGFRLDSCSGSPRKCRYVALVVNPTSASGSGRLNPTSVPIVPQTCSWCTNQNQCAASCGQSAWKGESDYCSGSGDGCCECGGLDDNGKTESGPSSSVWFNGTVMEGGNRWMDKKRKDDGTAKHDWPSKKTDCVNKVGIGFDVSRNVRLGWIEDDNGGHFDMRVYKNREFTVILQPPTECGLTCGSWKVFDRGDKLKNAANPTVVAEGTGCGLTFMPKTSDWQSGIEFSLVPIATPSIGECNRLGGADLAEMELWRADYVTGQMGDIQKADWAGDFNCDGYVDIDDREIWREAYMLNLGN
ncbi:hypothetical protein KJ909_02485 [Patescibacteria group bacterium]|nr:hypothetical protein [Patescibacteria group bacterium]